MLVASLDRCLSLVSVVPEADVSPGFFLCLDHFLDILGFQCVPGSSLARRRKLSGELLSLFHTPTELYLFIYFLADNLVLIVYLLSINESGEVSITPTL